MRFSVIERNGNRRRGAGVLVLEHDNWDDYCYRTTFDGYYRGERIGSVKIAYASMAEGDETYGRLPFEFDELPDSYFSLWQSEGAYEKLRAIEESTGERIFEPLRDIAFDTSILDRFLNESSLHQSLFRSVSVFTCRGQLHRIATGGKTLIEYHFAFDLASGEPPSKRVSLSFDVVPNDCPPSNVHALIGRNGTGKTRLIQDFVCSVCGQSIPGRMVRFDSSSAFVEGDQRTFANVLCIAFGPFDNFDRVQNLAGRAHGAVATPAPSCHYIGLDKTSPNLLATTEDEFIRSFKECKASERKQALWKRAMGFLRSDPAFADACAGIMDADEAVSFDSIAWDKLCRNAFNAFSSGHKVVLAIVTSCVSCLEERSLVFVDEPENHLHPPLLAALIRALSYLLIDRNSVALIATHSPVVLQEVPRSCVWMLNRSGEYWRADRPRIETFGADFESLTSQVFGYEVQSSGFHKMLQDAVDESDSLDDAIGRFGNQLGSEANALIRILWAQKESSLS